MTRLILLCAAVAAGAACGARTTTRGALVPRPVPSPRAGTPMTNLVEAAATAGTIADIRTPERSDEALDVTVPRHQGRAEFRFRPRNQRHFDLSFIYERALAEGGYHLDDEDTPAVQAAATGAGMGFHYASGRDGSRFHLGLGAEFLLYSIPYVEYERCIDPECAEQFTVLDRANTRKPVAVLSFTPAFDITPSLGVYGSVQIRNHPAVELARAVGTDDVEISVTTGSINLTATGGVEYRHCSGVRASAFVYQEARRNPVAYGPTFGASVTVPLFRQPPSAAARARLGVGSGGGAAKPARPIAPAGPAGPGGQR